MSRTQRTRSAKSDNDAEFERLQREGEDRSQAARERVLALWNEFDGNEGIRKLAAITRRVIRQRPLRELFAELDDIESLSIEGKFGSAWRQQVARLAILRFLDKFMDGSGMYPAHFYLEQFGIPPARLRQAARRGKLKQIVVNKTTLYPFADVRGLWPHEVTFDPRIA